MGYSIGKWEGTPSSSTRQASMNVPGSTHSAITRSEQMQITERYLRRDFGHMDLEFTFDDPTYYTRPFSVKVKLNLLADSDLLEYVCENEHDRAHLGK